MPPIKHTVKTVSSFHKEPLSVLSLDEQTLLDLEVFESSDGSSIFQLCNFTCSQGGEAALKHRMHYPLASTDGIRKVQDSISYIIKNRKIFERFHSNNLRYITGNIATYMAAPLPHITSKNIVPFTLEAISFYAHTSHFSTVAIGVRLTSKLIGILRDLVQKTTCIPPEGEISPLLKEIETLLFNSPLFHVRYEDTDMGFGKFWQVLRLHQLFRVFEPGKISRLLTLTYEIDALISMADSTTQNQLQLPTVVDGPLEVYAEHLIHPYIENAVANPVDLNQDRRGLFLTGGNMAGKTTYLRAFAVSLYLAHLGMGVPAKVYRFTPAEKLISSISLSDNLHKGISYFRAEALRIKDVTKAIAEGLRVIAVIDEPFKGTNVQDTLEASFEILTRFLAMEKFLFIFASHQTSLTEEFYTFLDFQHFSAIESEEKLRFDYRLRPGVSIQRIGMRVLKEENVFSVLDKEIAECDG